MECMPWRVCFFFGKLSQYPPVIGEDDQSILEKFVVTMYDRSSATDSIDVARLELLSRKQRSYDSIPPTQAALIQHNKRAAYQAGCIWGQATICQWKLTALRTAVGRSKATCAKSFGQHFRQLPRVAKNWRSVTERRNSVAGAIVTALVFLAQLCVAVIATAKIYSKFDPIH